MNQRAAQRQFLFHAAGQFAGRPVGKRIQTGRGEQVLNAPFALAPGLVEQAAEEVEILEYGQGRVEVAPEALRHIGNAGQAQPAMLGVGHIAIQCEDLAFLDPPHPCNQRKQSGLADAVRPNQPDHAPGRYFECDIVERNGPAIAVRQPSHHRGSHRHHGSFTASLSGQTAFGSVRTYPMPRTPVLMIFS